MSVSDLPRTVDENPNPVCTGSAPQSTTAPQIEASAVAMPGLDQRGYELVEWVGGGGMGDMYRAGDPALGRDLAVKVMKTELQGYAAAEQRFLREARVTGSLYMPPEQALGEWDAVDELEQRTAKLGADHPDTIVSRNNLATAYYDARRTAEAIPLLEQSLKQLEAKLGTDHPSTLTTRSNLANAYRDDGRTTEAIRLLEQTLKQCEAKLGRDHPQTLHAMANLGVIYADTGRLNDAISLLETARERGRKRPGGLPATIAWVSPTLVQTYERAGQFEKAEPIHRDWLEQVQHQFGPDDSRTAGILARFGNNLLMQKKFPDAESLLRRCLKIREAKQPDEWNTCNTRSMLGEALVGQKKYAEAELLLVQGYNGMKQRQDKIPPSIRQVRLTAALERVVHLYEATEQKDKAAEWRKKLEEAKGAQKKTKPQG